MDEVEMRRAAVRAAYLLARAHGHEWGEMLDEGDVLPLVSESWEDTLSAIAALTAERSNAIMGGIAAPSVTLRPAGGWSWCLSHSTVTGRVEWRIYPTWVEISVFRPAGRIFSVQIHERGKPSVFRYAVPGDGRIHERHLEAAQVCLSALGVEAELPDPDPED